MNILITGASGFLGSAVVEQLIENNHDVTVLVRPDSDLTRLNQFAKLRIIQYTSLASKELTDLLKEKMPSVFFHFGWKGITGENRNEAFQFSDNLPLTLSTIQLAANTGCVQWIGCGSQAEYGITNTESYETDVCNPLTAYGKAKLAAGIAALGMAEALGINAAWCRIFSLYGPGDHPSFFIPYLIQQFKRQAAPQVTSCEQQWDYLYKTDAASALIALAQKNATGVFNIGSGSTVSLREIVEKIKKLTKSNINIGYGVKSHYPYSPMFLKANINKIQLLTDWCPEISIEEGLQHTVNYYMQYLK